VEKNAISIAEKLYIMTKELEEIAKPGQEKKTELSVHDVLSSEEEKVSAQLYRLVRLLALKGLLDERGGLTGFLYRGAREIGLEIGCANFEEAQDIVQRLMLGKLEFAEGESGNVILHQCVACAGVPQVGFPICHFEAGFLAGLLSSALKERVHLRERKCRAAGDEYCEFERVSPSQLPYKGFEETDIYSQENVELLTTLASHAIRAIENAVLYERTKQQTIVDDLTKVYNKRYFHDRLHEEFERAKRHGFSLSLLLVDIDFFKTYNDTYGHMRGDELLQEIAAIIRRYVREIDVVARFGGDEFAIILPQTDLEGALTVAERLRGELARRKFPNASGERDVEVTASFGAASLNGELNNADALIGAADGALYEAKKRGRNSVCAAR